MAGRVIGAKLALFVGEDLATLQRDDRPGLLWPGYWDLPGGGIEPGETPLYCAVRETREELGLIVNPDLVRWGRAYGTSSGDIAWFFAAHVPAGIAAQIVLGDEGQGWALMSVDAFLAHDKVVPQFKPRLGDYLAGAASGRIDRCDMTYPPKRTPRN